MILHLTNGEAMMEYLENNNINLGEYVEPFNEAMSIGEVSEDIFGAEFCEFRASEHGVIQEDYEDIVLLRLENFLAMEYEELHMYFDDDVHCAMNLITVLAYLDRNSYEGSVILHIIDKNYLVIKDVRINIVGFYQVYLSVLLNHKKPLIKIPEFITGNIDKYLKEYSAKDNF